MTTGKLCKLGFRRGAGFTLIEMLVVITIILILIAILLSIAGGVRNRAKRRETLAELKILEGVMRDYLKTNQEPLAPAAWPAVYSSSGNPAYDDWNAAIYSIDPTTASNPNPTKLRPSDITNWVAQLMADPDIAAKLANLPRGRDISNPALPVILDYWGNPIRFVPSHTGITSAGNYNMAISSSMFYFISTGPDGRFSMSANNTNNIWPADEVYSTDAQ